MRGAARFVTAVALFAATSLSGHAYAAKSNRPEDEDRPYWRTNLFKRVATDQKFLVVDWWPRELRDPAFTAPLAVGLSLAVQSGARGNGGWDRQWESRLSNGSGSGVRSAASGFTKLGNGPAFAAVLGITYLAARRAHNDRAAEVSSLAVESLINAGLWSELLKHATARVRPGGNGAGEFFHSGAQQSNSFPSGHAMGAFSVASVFAETYRDKRWVPWFSYGMASLIGASRLALGRTRPPCPTSSQVARALRGRQNRQENAA